MSKNGCKYCTNNDDKWKPVFSKESKGEVKIYRSLCVSEGSVTMSVDINPIGEESCTLFVDRFKFNFCPMCGRRLGE